VTSGPHVLVAEPLSGIDSGDLVAVADATIRHLRRVLRLADGAALSITDGAGRMAEAVLEAEGARLRSAVTRIAAPAPRLVLAQALSKGRRAEDAVRVACELGVDLLVPVVAERTQGRLDARASETLVTRWRAVAAAALEQSRGAWLAGVTAPVSGPVAVPSAVPSAAPSAGSSLRLIAAPGAPALPEVLRAADLEAAGPQEIVVAIGPEGGWSAQEVASASADGWVPVGLGPTVLRTEHAGPAAVAVIAALAGRWSGGSAATLEV
jgi:16S rRNA (uracil1498-N3)-methyltransferase